VWLADRRVEELGAADLFQATVPHTDLFVSAAPNQHGFQVSRAEGEPLREPVGARGAPLERRRHTLRVVSRVLLATLVAVWSLVFYAYGREPVRRGAEIAVEDAASRRITPTNWPERDWSAWHPLPLKESAIVRADELQYFRDLLPLLEEGANNRLNMHGGLRVTRPADAYGALHEVYRQRQSSLLARLAGLAAPARLHGVHRHVVVATEQQIAFFDAFVKAKVQDPTVDLGRMLNHATVVTASRELRTAWDEVRALYPILDRSTSDAIERRLDQFDVL